jgi:hypothetical protein
VLLLKTELAKAKLKSIVSIRSTACPTRITKPVQVQEYEKEKEQGKIRCSATTAFET